MCECVCASKQNKCTISCYWIPLLETLTTVALGEARKLGQILSHSEMGHINAASKIVSMNSPENQVLDSTGLTLAWLPLLQVKETYLCSGVALKELLKKIQKTS